MTRDTIIGIVGSAILVIAMVGVFVYERSVATAATVPGASGGPAGSEAIAAITGSVQVADRDAKAFHVTATRVLNVTLHLTWTATNGKDTLRLTITPPAGSNAAAVSSQSSDVGDVTLTAKIPAGGQSQGDWGVAVDFVKAEPSPLPGGIAPPVPPPNSTDSSVSYQVAITLA